MNERIKQLAGQAKKYSIDKLDETGELHKYYDVYFEKFAELIVGECVGIADEYDGVGSTIVSRIKQHFGVE